MKTVIQSLFCAFLMFSLTACNTTKQQTKYLQSQTIKPITVPTTLSSSSIESHYPIPTIQATPPKQSIPIIPPKVVN
jgi:uncharacterized lipoprotein